MQCGNCSVVCTKSPENAPFPRPQMLAAQWGLKDRLVADPALWLCHNCAECTAQCPRGARPGDVLGALRRHAIEHFAFPRFMGRLVNNPYAAPILFLIPALIFLAIALWSPRGPAGPAPEFADVIPIPILEALFFAVAGLVILVFAVGIARFVKATDAGGFSIEAIGEILTHRRFENCGARRTGHLLLFWSFLGLALMGTIVGIGTMAGLLRTPLPLAHPLKIFANICAIVILAGILLRLGSLRAATYFDRLFFLTLAGVAATGIASELLRLAQAGIAMYVVYFVHLVLIFALFLYAPYGKFAHLAYRTVAIAIVRKD
jgi:quinone-modifying oxidoreductase subunit QmoC